MYLTEKAHCSLYNNLTPCLQNSQEGQAKVYLIEYDTESDTIYRDSTDGMCREAKEGKPGLLVMEVTEGTKFAGYSNKKQTEKKIIRVCH